MEDLGVFKTVRKERLMLKQPLHPIKRLMLQLRRISYGKKSKDIEIVLLTTFIYLSCRMTMS